jgi:phospholipid-binding lipoprotein MlaA
MKGKAFLIILLIFSAACCAYGADSVSTVSQAEDSVSKVPTGDVGKGMDDSGNQGILNEPANDEPLEIADPLEPFNRAMFVFNDKLYFWVLKPVAKGYNVVAPETVRIGVDNFFSNLRFPIRFVSCLLQAKFKSAAVETGRFGINTTVGILGFMDPASGKKIDLQKQDTDLGLTLGSYGIGQGFYIEWPFLGPSSGRDTVGLVGNLFLNPEAYIRPWTLATGVWAYEMENSVSLRIGDYESLKQAAIDPYISVRDAYVQYRQNKLEGKNTEQEKPVTSPEE